ncbi:MAG: hypothetical protein QOJ81_287 [Chloroflexota bacterium]|nr:hypothetical protein [Chloroflexota bacterium]
MAGEQRREPKHDSPFDVPGWLTELTGIEGWSVQRTFTRRKVEYVTDYIATTGAKAEVTLQALRTAGQASWEMVAKSNGVVAGVVIPARTRIVW